MKTSLSSHVGQRDLEFQHKDHGFFADEGDAETRHAWQ